MRVEVVPREASMKGVGGTVLLSWEILMCE